LLVLARAEPEAGAMQRRQRLDLVRLAADVGAEMVPRARQAGVDLGLDDATPGPVAVEANPLLLREALANLVDNAILYAGRGATVTVRVAERAGAAIAEVEDNGPGIADADRARVFERFARATHVGDGCGLGLAIVSEIVERHGGSIALEPVRPHGLRVRLQLPLAPA
jgi:two-component system sensor histidine kinase TctE